MHQGILKHRCCRFSLHSRILQGVVIGNKTNLAMILLVIKEIKRMDSHGLTYDNSRLIVGRANKLTLERLSNSRTFSPIPSSFSLPKSNSMHEERGLYVV